MELEALPELAKRMHKLLCRSVEECRNSHREIARRAGISKDTLHRVIAGSREVTVGEARQILAVTGKDPETTLLLLLFDGEEFERLWFERKALDFLTGFIRAMPSALEHRLGDRAVDWRPKWGAGAAKIVAASVAKMVDDDARMEREFVQKYLPRPRRSRRKLVVPAPSSALPS